MGSQTETCGLRRISRVLLGMVACGALGLAFTGCGSTVTTRIHSPSLHPPAGEVLPPRKSDPSLGKVSPIELAQWAGSDPARLQGASKELLQRSKTQKNTKNSGRGGYALAACELAWRSLNETKVPASHWLSNPQTRDAADLYRSALKIFVSENAQVLASGRGTLEIETPLGAFQVTPRFAAGGRFPAGTFDTLIPADDVQTTGFTKKLRVTGLGAPLVGVRERTPDRAEEMQFQLPKIGVHSAIGSLARFDHTGPGVVNVTLDFYDLDRTPTVRIRGKEVALAGDFTAPMALSFGGTNDLSAGVASLFNLDGGFGHNGIYLTEPFDPNRIPVLLLHGLFASPLAWRNVVSQCMEAPAIRENYQFWYGYFSTGMPITPSAALLRARIASIRAAGDPNGSSRASKNMILIGHSMGGVIARALATDIGNHYWEAISNKPFQDIPMKPEERALLRSWFFWKPATDVKELIFLATPHRGTRMSDFFLVQLSKNIVELPKSFFEFETFVLSGGQAVSDNHHLSSFTKSFTKSFGGTVTGIDSLSKNSPIYEAFANAPIVSSASTHTIVGDRGRGDTPKSSDGVIEYWSSHLPSAASEIIVKGG
jgi:pimeloyl-ACP methyl ester carboxylesterase